MATGLPGYNITPLTYSGKDGILFHLKDDMSVFLNLTATTDMSFQSTMEVTTQPVQSGQTVTDNVQEKPSTININGVVVVGYDGIFLLTENTTVVEDFVTTLQRWRSQKQVLRVICKDGITLDNAICTNFEAKKDTAISNGLNISLAFQDVDFVVQVGQTEIQATNANGSKKAKTKKGAVTSKKDLGKTGTQVKMPSNCKDVFKLDQAGANTGEYGFIKRAMDGCKRTWSSNMATGQKYNEKEGAKYFPKNSFGSQGGNITAQVK